MTTWTTVIDGVPVESTTTAKTPTTWNAISGGFTASDSSDITYTPDGTNTVNTTVQEKLREFISVKDFGATGDGVTDDTAAIQAAITACYGKTLYVNPGLYLISSTISISSGLEIVGVYGQSVFVVTKYFNPVFTTTFPSAPTRSVVNLIIKNVVFDGNSVAPQRWLQNSSGTTITNPEDDYVPVLGDLASGITGVSLTAVLSGDAVASVTVNTGGSGWNGHPDFPYLPSTVPLKFTGGDGSGAAGYATISAGTIATTTITSGGVGYTSPPAVSTMGGYADIALLVDPSVNRRNANYTQVSTMLRLYGTENTLIENCIFKNHYGRAIFEAGGLNVTINNNVFDTVGKNDGPYHCIYTQSYGTPGGGQSFYSPSENIRITNNKAKNLERSFVAFMPTKGGVVEGNFVDGWQESCIYISDNLHYDGGSSIIKNNVLNNGTVSDIVGNGIEASASTNLIISDNTIYNSEDSAISATGCVNVNIKNNIIKECFVQHDYPFGPFSERYSFNVGKRPIAGTYNAWESGSVINIGSLGAIGCENLIISDNSFIDARTSCPSALFLQSKSGTDNASKLCVIENNYLSIPVGMTFIDTSIGNVWDTNIPLFIRNNAGHVSIAPVVETKTFDATGAYTVDVGFRPSVVHVYAASATTTAARGAVGEFSWNSGGVRNDFSLGISTTSGTGQIIKLLSTDVVRIVDASDAVTFLAEFSSWTETGFIGSIVTCTEDTNVKFVCYP